MERLTNNPGFQHLAENIFLNLNNKTLEKCQLINQSAGQILDNPLLWIEKCFRNGLSVENQRDWIEVIQSELNPAKKKHIIAYLKWNLQIKKFDFPCYTKRDVQRNFIQQIWFAASDGHTEIVKVLAPLTNNPNAPNEVGITPIYKAAAWGYTEIVEILAPLADFPNAPDKLHRNTPIYWAACNGHTKIVKILAPLTDFPNVPDKWGNTPSYMAASRGYTKIVNILIWGREDTPWTARGRGALSLETNLTRTGLELDSLQKSKILQVFYHGPLSMKIIQKFYCEDSGKNLIMNFRLLD